MSAHVAAGPVTPDDRVSDVLARDESLVEVFLRNAPQLARLRNRAMRRVMARLVTVEQAARIAGVSAEVLARELNDALGIAPSAMDVPEAHDASFAATSVRASTATLDGRRVHPTDVPIVELDVREALRAEREPFSQIMTAVATAREGEVLHVRATFEPVPLLAVLATRGFAHETREHAPDDWSVWFWRPAVENAASARRTPAAPEASDREEPSIAADASTVMLDVRDLEPPEPLVRTLAALETLPAGHTLIQVNVRVPQFLLPTLAERGFACEIDESHTDRVLVRIWRPA